MGVGGVKCEWEELYGICIKRGLITYFKYKVGITYD